MMMLCAAMLVILILIITAVWMIFFKSNVKDEVEWEAGSGVPAIGDFLKKEDADATLLTSMDSVNLTTPGSYPVQVQVGKKTHEVTLKVVDTQAPQGTAVDQTGILNAQIEAASFVTNIQDVTEVTVSYESQPDFTKAGTQDVSVVLKDAGGNKTTLTAKLTLVNDSTSPVIEGVQDQTVEAGSTISYKQGVTVTDDQDPNVKLEIDNSGVDLTVPGSYTVTYTAIDAAGNKTTQTATITVTEKKDTVATDEEIARMEWLAGLYLDQIITADMTMKEKAEAIWHWCNWEIDYVDSSDKSSWVKGALQAFDTHHGDCFTYFAAAKALLTQAGIPNLDVVKSDTSHSAHYWSLVDVGDGWYHFDTTPREGGGDYFFLVTDAQLLEYSEANGNSHIFDQSLYPATPETIITDMNDGP